MLLVGVVPLLVGLGMAFWQGSKEIHEVSGESFKALATEAARKLDILVGEEIGGLPASPRTLSSSVSSNECGMPFSANLTTPSSLPDDRQAKWEAKNLRQ